MDRRRDADGSEGDRDRPEAGDRRRRPARVIDALTRHSRPLLLGGATLLACGALAGCTRADDATTQSTSAATTPATTTTTPPTTAPPRSGARATTTTTTSTEPPIPTIPSARYDAGELPPGEYRVLGYWALLDESDTVIDNDLTTSCPTVMVVPDGDVVRVELDGETFPIAEQQEVDPIEEGCQDGTFLVGVDIEPGQYRIVPDDLGASWARFDGSRSVVDSHASEGPIYVDVLAEDYAVTFRGLGVEVSDHPTVGMTPDELDAYVSATARTAWDELDFDDRAAICGAIAEEDTDRAIVLAMRDVRDDPNADLLAERLYSTAAADCGE